MRRVHLLDRQTKTRIVRREQNAPPRVWTMAKPATLKIKMVSTADTGYYYVTKKNPRTQTEKLTLRRYDPVVRKHVEFKEGKIK